MEPLVIRPDTRLEGDLDVEEAVARIPTTFKVKGAFVGRVASAMRDEPVAIGSRLMAPPKLGRYLPFSDYPMVDYARLLLGCAHKLYPSVGMREAVRRFARDDFKTFAESVLGRVTMATVGDLESAFAATPTIFRYSVSGGPRVEVVRTGVNTYRVDFDQFHIPWEYAVGQYEGVVAHYGRIPTIAVPVTDPAHFTLDVSYM